MRRFLARLANLFRGPRMESELAREIESHLALLEEDYRRRGLSPDEARLAARRAYGGVEQAKELHREARSFIWIEQTFKDVRYGVRMLYRNPGFTLVAALTLALGIGANTAIFSVVNAVLLRPLPYPDPSRIAQFMQVFKSGEDDSFTVPQYRFLREHTPIAFEAIAAYRGAGTLALKQQGRLDWINAVCVTEDFFGVFGVRPSQGRAVERNETQPGGPNSAVLSDALWRRAFGGDPRVIGAAVTLDDAPYTVVGILPQDFKFLEQPADVFIPLQLGSSLSDQGKNTSISGRIKPDVSLKQAQAELKVLFPQLPDRSGSIGISATSYQQALAGDLRPNLLVLFGAVGLLLLIACANVASLILARASSRAREMSVRLALGAGRGRLLRQFLAESFVMSLIAAAAGALAAFWALRSLVAAIPWDLPSGAGSVSMDGYVFAFTLGTAVFTSLLFGLSSFWQTTRINLVNALKESSMRAGGGAHNRIRNVLVIGEVALSLTLLVGAALLAETLYNLHRENLGFDPENLITLVTPYPDVKPLTPARIWQFEQDLLARFQAIPGVASAAVVSVAPLTGKGNLPAQVAGNDDEKFSIGGTEIRAVSSRYFQTMRIPLLRGREIQESDVAAGAQVAVINERLARRWWPDSNPIGQRLVVGEFQGQQLFDPPAPPREVVGVVADVKGMMLGAPAPPMIYVPVGNNAIQMGGSTAWVVRGDSNRGASNEALGAAIRRAVQQLDPQERVLRLRAMSEVVSGSVAAQSFDALLMSSFAGVALALASVGIYGVLSFFVSQRTHEIGVRMALGAEPGQVLRVVVGQGLALALAGVVIGVGAALGLTRFLRGLLYHVSAASVAPYAVGALVLLAVALLASYIPARRATRVDPVVALRYE
jgi:putative ABC transport system permease protein